MCNNTKFIFLISSTRQTEASFQHQSNEAIPMTQHLILKKEMFKDWIIITCAWAAMAPSAGTLGSTPFILRFTMVFHSAHDEKHTIRETASQHLPELDFAGVIKWSNVYLDSASLGPVSPLPDSSPALQPWLCSRGCRSLLALHPRTFCGPTLYLCSEPKQSRKEVTFN